MADAAAAAAAADCWEGLSLAFMSPSMGMRETLSVRMKRSTLGWITVVQGAPIGLEPELQGDLMVVEWLELELAVCS